MTTRIEKVGLSRRLSGPTMQRPRRCRFDPWVGKIPWREGMANHSTILSWRVPWTEEPGRLRLKQLITAQHTEKVINNLLDKMTYSLDAT